MLDIEGQVTISLDDYEKIKLELRKFEELKDKISNLYKEEFSHVDKVILTIDEYDIVSFISEYLNIKGELSDINVENNKIKAEWKNDDIPF